MSIDDFGIFTCLRIPSTVNDKEKETRKKPLTKLVLKSEMMGRSHGNEGEDVEKRRGSGDMVRSETSFFLYDDVVGGWERNV